jgi:hypothetical protein
LQLPRARCAFTPFRVPLQTDQQLPIRIHVQPISREHPLPSVLIPILPRKRSPLASSADAPVTEKNPSVRSPFVDESTAQPKKLQGEGTPCVSSSEKGDFQSDDYSISDATSDVGSSAPDTSAADVAQAAAIKQSLLTQIEERNEGKKWDDLLGFFHGLAAGPSEVGWLLKTATRAGQRALCKPAGKEAVESGPSNREHDARVLGRYVKLKLQ